MDNPNVFPHTEEDYVGDGTYERTYMRGLSLRDYFAGQAVYKFRVPLNKVNSMSEKDLAKDMAELSYLIADAMIEERDRGE